MNGLLLLQSLGLGVLVTLGAFCLGWTVAVAAMGSGTRERKVWQGIAVAALALPPFWLANSWLELLSSVRLSIPKEAWDGWAFLATAGILISMLWPIVALSAWAAWDRLQAAQLEAQRATLLSEQLSQEVFSPASGRLLDLAVVPGQAVAPGQRLGSIGLQSHQAGKLALVLFTVADSSRLEVGDEVMLNPQLLSRDSFGSAEQRYGLVPGRLLSLSSESVDVADVGAAVGSQEEAANLMASARQKSFGDGGDLTAQLPGRTGAPLVLGVVRLKVADTPSGLAWTRGQGPARPLPQRTPTEVEAEVEKRAPLSYLLPFWRWIAGARG